MFRLPRVDHDDVEVKVELLHVVGVFLLSGATLLSTRTVLDVRLRARLSEVKIPCRTDIPVFLSKRQ